MTFRMSLCPKSKLSLALHRTLELLEFLRMYAFCQSLGSLERAFGHCPIQIIHGPLAYL